MSAQLPPHRHSLGKSRNSLPESIRQTWICCLPVSKASSCRPASLPLFSRLPQPYRRNLPAFRLFRMPHSVRRPPDFPHRPRLFHSSALPHAHFPPHPAHPFLPASSAILHRPGFPCPSGPPTLHLSRFHPVRRSPPEQADIRPVFPPKSVFLSC